MKAPRKRALQPEPVVGILLPLVLGLEAQLAQGEKAPLKPTMKPALSESKGSARNCRGMERQWLDWAMNVARWIFPCARRWSVLAVLPVVVSCSGCITRIAAGRLIAAPNAALQKNAAGWNAAWTNFLTLITTNRLVPISIPVGPPDATLSVLEVAPGEYHRKFVTRVDKKPDGGGTFFLILQTNLANTFTRLPEPATIILLHGYGMMKEGMAPWAFQLAQAGYRVLAVDLRGHGQSTGSRIGFGKFETSDLSQMLDAMRARGLCDGRVGVLGVSYGATLALHWAAREPRIQVVVAIAPYDSPEVAFERFAKMANLPFPPRLIRRAANRAASRLDLEWRDWSGAAAIRRVEQPVLLVTGGKDPICPPEDLERLRAAALGKAKTVIVPEANHYVIGVSLDSLAEPVQGWLREHLVREPTSGAALKRRISPARSAARASLHCPECSRQLKGSH